MSGRVHPAESKGEPYVLRLANGTLVVCPADAALWFVNLPREMTHPFGDQMMGDNYTAEQYVRAVREHADSVEMAAACVKHCNVK